MVTTSSNPCLRPSTVEQGEKVREQIVLGTPGIVLDWILKKKALDPTKIVLLVVDQADVFITTQGYQDQTIRISKWADPCTLPQSPAYLLTSLCHAYLL